MALVNPNIAMSFRAPEIQQPNMLADYAAIQQIQGGRQAQELNALKMQEAQAALQERNALRQLNPTAADYEAQLFKVNPTLGIQFRKEQSTAKAQQAAQAKSEFDLKAAQRKFGDDLKRSLSSNPSDENIIAFGQDALIQGLYSQDQVNTTVSQLLALPTADRVRILSQAGASASELKPTLTPQNLGGTARILSTPAFGGAATQVVGSEGTVTATPAQIETNRLSQARLAFDQNKFNWEKANPGFEIREADDGSVVGVNKRTLQAFPVTLGGGAAPTPTAAPAAGGVGMPGARMPAAQAPLAGATPTAAKPLMGKGQGLTEGERKASTLLQRLQFSEGQLTKALVDDPDAAKPGVFTSALDVLSTPLANTLTPEARQRVQSAQLDILDAALTLGTGAAYTKEQLEGYRSSYFPAIGDGPTQVKDKKARLQNVISAAKIAAGKGAKLIPDTSSSANANDPLGLLKGN